MHFFLALLLTTLPLYEYALASKVLSKDCSKKGLKNTDLVCPGYTLADSLPSGAMCCKSDTEDCLLSKFVATCNNGMWSYVKKENEIILLKREKRANAGVMATGVGIMLLSPLAGPATPFVFVFGWLVTLIGGLMPDPNHPPQMQCPKSMTFISDVGSTTKTVKWTMPRARDREDGDISSKVRPILGVKTYDEGSETETFRVKDSDGAPEQCAVSVTVKVPRCKPPNTPGNGTYVENINDFIHGVKMTFRCKDGYNIDGDKQIECLSNRTYNRKTPTCKPITCPYSDDLKPKFGKAKCDYASLEFQTICQTDCSMIDGYDLKDDVGKAVCMSNRQWSRGLPSCVDIKAPKFDTCPTDIEKIASEYETTANVSWETPTASDNSGLQPLIQQIKGPTSGSLFSEGITVIRYVAMDTEGNNSTFCEFDVIIEVRRCLPPSLKGKFLKYKPIPDYLLGSVVNVSCDGGFKLAGASAITCTMNQTINGYNMYWDIGNMSYPYCKQTNCSELQPPANGALACDKWLFGTMCQMQCNEKYDIPHGSGTGQYVCSMSSGNWKPNSNVPGCTEKKVPNQMVLPGTLFYYSGNCSDESTQQQIRENFIEHMKNLAETQFEGICTDSDECNVDNVEVRCGPVTQGRKKRSREKRDTLFETKVTFDINIKWVAKTNGTNTFVEGKNLLDKVSNKITADVENGTFDVEDMGIKTVRQSAAFGSPTIKCGIGQVPNLNKLSCDVCPLGFELNQSTIVCEKCPLNHYREHDSDTKCSKCPNGTITRVTGTTSQDDCKAKCSPGYSSDDGLEPCSKCLRNTYQPLYGSTVCNYCPTGTMTIEPASTSMSDCLGFDIAIDGKNGSVTFGSIDENLTDFSIALWVKTSRDIGGELIVRDSNENVIFRIGETVTLSLFGLDMETNISNGLGTWNHVAFKFNKTAAEITIFISGDVAYRKKTNAVPQVINAGASFIVESQFTSGRAIISNIILTSRAIPDDHIRNLSALCSMEGFKNNLLIMENPSLWRRFNSYISIPSVCDDFNECLSSPCGNHSCENKLNGYDCTCSNGFSGKQCEIAPDNCKIHQCQNEASCISLLDGYTCTCAKGFKGKFCQIAIVDGQWTKWTAWSSCSVSCNGGLKQRTRLCSNPVPDPDGEKCVGLDQENATCSEDKCPECPEFPRVYGVMHDCNKTDGMVTCNVSCRPGLAFIPSNLPLNAYECGRDTNYKWSAIPPSCTEFYSPKVITTNTQVTYPNLKCSDQETAKRQVIENSKSLQCIANKTCKAEIHVKGCDDSDDGDVPLSLSVQLKTEVSKEDLDLETFSNTSKPNEAMHSFLNSLNDLGISAKDLNTSKEVYQVRIGGDTYDADMNTASTGAAVDCREGKVPSVLLCADCPQGTYYKEQKCVKCDFGTFQDELGQVACKQCPENFTTDYRGAKLLSECNVLQVQVATSTQTNVIDDSENQIWIPIVAGVLAAIILVVMIIATWLLWKKHEAYFRNHIYIFREKSKKQKIYEENPEDHKT